MLFNHTDAAVSYSFDEPNLVSAAGLVPLMRLAQRCGLAQLAQQMVTVVNTGADKGANAGAKISSLVAGMAAGADSFDDLDLLRHGGMKTLFDQVYAPSTLGSHLREYTHGHVKQLAAVASRFLTRLGSQAALLPVGKNSAQGQDMIFVDIDDTVVEVYSPHKHGAGIGYTNIRGLNALLVTASTAQAAPIIIGQQLRKGAAHSARGAHKLLSDALATLQRMPRQKAPVVVRADSAYYSAKVANTVIANGADLSVTVPMQPNVKAAIAAIKPHAWQRIQYSQAIWDQDSQRMVSAAEVAEINFTAFSSKKDPTDHLPGRLIVRRIPELNTTKLAAAQGQLFPMYRYHAVFTTIDETVLDTVAADKTHRQHAIIEQVHAELKAGPLAHMPSKAFQANAAWLVAAAMTHNLLRTAAVLIGGNLTRARALSIRQKIVSIPARIAHRARRLILHLPTNWAWATAFSRLWNTTLSPPLMASNP